MAGMEVKLPDGPKRGSEKEGFVAGALEMLKRSVGMAPKKGETHEALEGMREKQGVASLLMLGITAFIQKFSALERGEGKEEKEKKEEDRQDEQPVATVVTYRGGTKGAEEPDKAKEEAPDKQPKNPVELANANEAVFIGASHAHGYGMKVGGSEFIGQDGKSSSDVLGILRANRGLLEGKKMAVLQGYGNDGFGSPEYDPEKTVDNMRSMVDMCRDAGIRNISVTLHLPYGPSSKGERYTPNMLRASAAIREAFGKPPYSSYVNIIDLYTPFADKKTGLIREEYEGGDGDWLHPREAYNDVLREISERGGNNIDRFMKG